MSNQSQVDNGFTRLVAEVRLLKVWSTGVAGAVPSAAQMTALTTTATNFVDAINELDAAIADLSAGAAGIDDGVVATSSTWSSQKTSDELVALKDEILGGAGGAYDTLQELKDLLDASDAGDDSAITAINTALSNRLRVDAAQGLTGPQKQFGRDNLDVWSKTEIGDVAYDYVADIEAALA